MAATTGKPLGWVGSLQKVPLPEVLRKIALEERSGDLQVISGRTIKTAYFDRGFLVFAASNLKRDRLGESMIERGRISRHEFALASMLMKNSRRRFGQALVQAGVISEEELGRQVALQVNRIVMSLFKFHDAIYSFDERRCIIPVELMVSLSIYRIVLDGIRRMPDHTLLIENLPPATVPLRVSERPPFTADFNRLKPVEQDVLRAAGRGAPLQSILRLPQERDHLVRACYGLYAAGLLEPAGPQARARPLKVQEETGVFVLSEIQQKFARIRATNTREEILMQFDRLERVTDRELLDVGPDTTPEDVRKAYEKRSREWEEKKRVIETEHSMVAKVSEIQSRLEKAYHDMTTACWREPAPEATPAAEEAEGERRTEAEPIRQPPPLEVFESSLPPLEEDLIEEVSADFGFGLAPEATPPPDTQPDLEEPSPPLGPSGTVPAAVAAAQNKARIQQLTRDVKLHFQVRDWEGAVSLLYELVRLVPESAEYHGMLARAMARHPVMRKNAERHFIDALRLDPQSADLHFSLGLYYKSFGLTPRADAEFRTAIRINPYHEGARKHLSGDRRKKDPLRDIFRKIFG